MLKTLSADRKTRDIELLRDGSWKIVKEDDDDDPPAKSHAPPPRQAAAAAPAPVAQAKSSTADPNIRTSSTGTNGKPTPEPVEDIPVGVLKKILEN